MEVLWHPLLFSAAIFGVLICSKVAMSELRAQECENRAETCYQVVPYQPPAILPMFEQRNRSFEFAGKNWVVRQDWNDIGVAAVVWESAILLANYLVKLGPSLLSGAQVIELGAGTGLVGMVASALGASSVVLTDKDIRPAAMNLELNRHNLHPHNITSSVLEWGTNFTNFDPPYDVVLAADVIYIEETFPDLIQTLVDLTDARSVVLLACKYRYERDNRFFELLASSGKFEDKVVWTCQDSSDVKVHELRRIDLRT